MIKMGVKAKDKITGFTGVVTGECKYISGCDQVLLQPAVKKDGTAQDGRWFDVQRIIVDTKTKAIKLDNGKTPGADQAAPVR